jgi:hypothetical protein
MNFNDLIKELENLANKGFYTRGKIAWWLIKHEERYKGLSKIKYTLEAEFPDRNLREQKSFIKELLFLELYEVLDMSFKNSSHTNKEEIDLNSNINKIKASTNGLSRKDKNFKWDSNPR